MLLSHHSESNDMQYDLLWPDLTSDLRSNFDLDFLRSNWLSVALPRREEHNGSKIDALGPIGQKLLKKNIYAKNGCLTSVNFDLSRLNRWPEVKSETTKQIGRFVAHLLLLPLVAIYHSFGSRAAQLEPCTFDRKVRKFCNDDVIIKYWPRVTKFAPPRILIPVYLPFKFRVSSSYGSWDSGGGQILRPPPFQGA